MFFNYYFLGVSLQVLPGTLDPEELFNYLTPSDLPSEDILSMFE